MEHGGYGSQFAAPLARQVVEAARDLWKSFTEVTMSLLESLEKLGRAIFELPFSALNEAPELAEVRLAVLDAVKARSHRTGSVRVFSFGVVRVQLRGVGGAQAAAFQSGFFAEYLVRDLQTALARASVRFPEHLRVEVQTAKELPGTGQDWVFVEILNDTETEAAGAASAAADATTCALAGDPRESKQNRALVDENTDQHRSECGRVSCTWTGPPKRPRVR